jgi:ubiquinone/menaquinone biosynthesis C-methylase UbiE
VTGKERLLAAKIAPSAQLSSDTYDRVADSYDDLWSPKVVEPNARLTESLRLRRGDRIADLACGTGVYTIHMARRNAPGEVVAVDYSEGMLAAARSRAEEAGLELTLVNARAEEFIARSPAASFDVVSLRFLLAYIDWKEVLPRTGRLLRAGGRVGVLTSVTSSVPQFYQLYDKFKGSVEPVWKLFKHNRRDIPETWRMFRTLRETFADGRFIAVPDSAATVAGLLERGGLTPTDTWTMTIRLWFDSGAAAVYWIRNTGYAAHPALDAVGPSVVRFLEDLFAAGMETYCEDQGVPLDLVIAGVVAEKR